MRRLALVLIMAFAVTGCATDMWTPLQVEPQSADAAYTINFPEGWLKFDDTAASRMKDPLDRGVVITRQGTMLQNIRVGHMGLDEVLPSTKKTLNANMLPQEAAQVIADNFRMAEGVLQFNLIENAPADVGGHPGFKVLIEYKMDNRLWLKRLFYGTIVNDSFFFLQYHAPKRYYFDRDLDTFQQVVDSFKLAV